jgi:hypothetical protein
MSIYLVDYENVNTEGLNGVTKLTEADMVIIFYSEKADRMSFGLHKRLNETKASIDYRKVEVGGQNALDFQLATYLGFLIAESPTKTFYIVSNDKGFGYLSGFWKKPKYQVYLVNEIAVSYKENTQEIAAKSETSESEVAGIANILQEMNLKTDDLNAIEEIINKLKTKTGINNGLVKKFGSQMAGEIYKKIKPLLTDKKGR